jgi:N-acetylmuramoyl-L-alanine amidase
MPQLFLIAGHSLHDPGAVRGAEQEAKIVREQRQLLRKALEQRGLQVWTDPDTEDLRSVIDAVQAAARPDDYLLDLHFNAATPTATGTEVYVRRGYSQEEMTLGQRVAQTTAETLDLQNRGVKLESQTRHGRLGILHSGPGTSLLLETAFLTNPADLKAYRRYKRKLAGALADVLQAAIAPSVAELPD